jgi:argininosuccinate synthase
MTVPPQKAPNKPEYVEIEFEKGIPVSLNGKRMEGVSLINALNKIGGANGIGIVDIVENRVVGMKSRGVYETPGGSILYYAHQELEHLCLDRQTYSFKQQVSLKLSELIYGGLWFTPLREALSAFVDKTQESVNGKVNVKLYKGSITAAGAASPDSLYNTSLASFTTGELFNHADAKGFIKLYGLPVLVRSLKELEKKGGVKIVPASAKTNTKKKTARKK